MADEDKKKSSLTGRGREIMGGAPDDRDNEASEEEQSGSWLPRADEGEDETPEFEDEEALLKWMDVDPEEHRPTVRPDAPLVGNIKKRDTGELYPVPDFDAIFADSEPEPEPEPVEDESASLEGIFAEDDSSFDDLFGDVVSLEDEAISKPITMPDTDTQELPLYPTNRFAHAEDRGEASPELDDILQDRPMAEDDIPEPEEARDGIIVDDFGDEPAPRAHRRSSGSRDFDTGKLPELMADEEAFEPEFEPEPELARARMWDDSTADEPEHEPTYDPEPADDWVEATEPEGFYLGEATAILNEEFDEQEGDASTADQRTLDLLAEMTEDIDDVEQPAADMESTEAEASGSVAAFVSMLEHETVTDIVDELDEEMEAEPLEEPEIPLDLPEVDSSEERISEMVERQVATRAMEDPLEVVGIEEADRSRDSTPFALPPMPEDTQIGLPTEPLESYGEMTDEEAVPLGEDEHETVNLRMTALRRNSLETITPTEPETLSGDQIPTDLYEEYDYSAEEFEAAMESAGAEPIEDIGETGADYYPEEEELTRSSGMMIPSSQQPDPFGEREIRRPARDIFQPGSLVPDQELLRLFVDDNRLRELFELIEALQEEIVENVRGERGNTDTYQEELLEASNLLMQSRENYDEARAIVYRVRADLNRERRVDEDIRRFRPLINNIYIGMGIFVAVLAGLGELFISVADSVGVPWIGQGYYPALAGAVGALLFGVRTLRAHTTTYRDFDPSHVDWYIMNPLLGMVSGFLLYLFLLATSVTSVSSTTFEINGARPLILLAAVAVGYNQNVVISLLDTARQRLAPSNMDEPRREER